MRRSGLRSSTDTKRKGRAETRPQKESRAHDRALTIDNPIFWNPAMIDDSDLASEAKAHEHGLMALAALVFVAVLATLLAGAVYVGVLLLS
jgi:hypothetical protein